MGKTYTGIDIGMSAVKMVVCKDGAIKNAVSAQLPDNLLSESGIVSPAAMADFLKDTARENKIARGACALVLPGWAAFFRRTTMPAMSTENLKLNLPYEFRDFITGDREKYVFDYALLQMINKEDGTPESMDLMAAAAAKETVENYRSILRYAGFKLEIAVPEEIAFSNLIRRYEAENPGEEKREYAFLDLGHEAARLYFYTGVAHEATRVIEYGGRLIDAAIAESCNVDEHIAATYKLSDHDGALELPSCMSLYANLSIELMQALNFYNYNNPDNRLQDIYVCGGCAEIAPLLAAIRERIGLTVHPIEELMPPCAGAAASLYPLAYGATLC